MTIGEMSEMGQDRIASVLSGVIADHEPIFSRRATI